MNQFNRGLINAVFICYWFNEVICLQNYRKCVDNGLQMIGKKRRRGNYKQTQTGLAKITEGWHGL